MIFLQRYWNFMKTFLNLTHFPWSETKLGRQLIIICSFKEEEQIMLKLEYAINMIYYLLNQIVNYSVNIHDHGIHHYFMFVFSKKKSEIKNVSSLK